MKRDPTTRSAFSLSIVREELRDFIGQVLAVAVHLDRDVEAFRQRVAKPGLDGAADAEVIGKPHDERSGRLAFGRGAVRGAVVHHEHRRTRQHAQRSTDDLADRGRLVHGGDNDDHAPRGRHIAHNGLHFPSPAAPTAYFLARRQ